MDEELTEPSNFDEIVLKYKDLIFNVCYRFMGNYEDANDCAQDTFVKAFHSLKDFKGGSKISTWLYVIGANTCKNKLASMHYRRDKSAVRLDKPVETGDGEATLQVPDNDPEPPVALEQNETGAKVQGAINSLNPAQKELIILRDIEGLSYEEIAEVTGNNLGTVKSKLSRARLALKDKLKGLI